MLSHGSAVSWTFIILFWRRAPVLHHDEYCAERQGVGSVSVYSVETCFLSMLAAIQAPVIMMSQNRQDTKESW